MYDAHLPGAWTKIGADGAPIFIPCQLRTAIIKGASEYRLGKFVSCRPDGKEMVDALGLEPRTR